MLEADLNHRALHQSTQIESLWQRKYGSRGLELSVEPSTINDNDNNNNNNIIEICMAR